jgi:hypothetical protein
MTSSTFSELLDARAAARGCIHCATIQMNFQNDASGWHFVGILDVVVDRREDGGERCV